MCFFHGPQSGRERLLKCGRKLKDTKVQTSVQGPSVPNEVHKL